MVSMDGLSELQTSDETSRHHPSQSRCDRITEGSPGTPVLVLPAEPAGWPPSAFLFE